MNKGRIFITGDTHGFNGKDWDKIIKLIQSKKIKKCDWIIICGDCGFKWTGMTNTEEETYWKRWITDRGINFLCILGNHENMLFYESLYANDKLGGWAWQESNYPTIYYAKHGEIYNINNKKIWTMNGGYSIDKAYRTEGISWWKQEIPTQEQLDYGLSNFIVNINNIDMIVTHTCPKSLEPLDLVPYKCEQNGIDKTLENYLEKIYQLGGKYKDWYCGHWHIDKRKENINFVYQNIIEI